MMEAQHTKPVWYHKADYVLGVHVTDSVWSGKYRTEQIAAREIGDGTFEICCIPFLVYDICLGDIVAVSSDLDITKVVKKSSHFGFRVATTDAQQQARLLDQLRDLDILAECFSGMLCAMDTADLESARLLSAILAEAKKNGDIVAYETIRTT